MKRERFSGERYLTMGIQDKVPLQVQLTLWGCIEDLKKKNIAVDYLQVFKTKVDENSKQLIIEHSQEMPEYSKIYFLDIEINTATEMNGLKLFVIDDGEYSTMLLAEEY